MTKPSTNTCLIVIDGWGISPEADPKGDAIRNADTPVMTDLQKRYPTTELDAHGLAVGLPDGLMGNSEVGHLNIGAGRIVYQDIVRIDLSIKNKTLAQQPALVDAFKSAKEGNGRLHLLGLISDGGVHSHIRHLFELLEAAKDYGVPKTFVHFFGDGRDTAPRSADKYLQELLDFMKKIGYGSVATIVGRYYAMDRDKRWERIKVAYEGLVQGVGEKTDDPLKTVKERYSKDETDEFLKPIIVEEDGRVQDNDTLIFFNYRSDRMREITQAFGIETPFETAKKPKHISITTMTQYKADYPFPVIFPPQKMTNVLAEWLAQHDIPQSHIAETEKYAHVTFFFNGGTEAQYKREDREMIASPKVQTYDKKPEMSAIEVAQKVAETVETKKYPFVMCNFAPPDMVGHTGVYEAAIKGVEATDKGIGIIYEACKRAGYTLFITADHGNAEKMFGDNGQPHTAHTTARVPFIMTSTTRKFIPSKIGALADVAPTILEVMDLPIPEEMSGQSLLAK
ncbi:2,3-bisphosphoglycerate-independent phosphoglycerate mutase [Spizellomyces punctatus DAOM BR117]|uniref:2,3-bisphosphoglycerate-independent phosphoglycerate mutase n=1 Tax=Spizellomyces punctatus (strain DAOM BR117) TaxID=645134 RepID=A0A0L0HV99_SPIPD|nr:2,3-bisphosphoglycerate-independent phosphoglycerate mutase [Spizellomyces punctatus DAOM BR117]KND04804.1 2,3-bisphosphoglycerate-independent phosphoglycerate mutase [Spizellomyces punctatus DAOM BR117]|eukprot:XP_016612843.1 2,3-bisphosphoglycerate-independent phosphoglycerate mutase [Spizellomyces punctatus DAOM BR117]